MGESEAKKKECEQLSKQLGDLTLEKDAQVESNAKLSTELVRMDSCRGVATSFFAPRYEPLRQEVSLPIWLPSDMSKHFLKTSTASA